MHRVEEKAPVAKIEEPVHLTRQPAQPDDLTVIEGIGPKIASVLGEAGIHTFKQLAATATDKLQEILHAASLAMADPGTWAEQAALAAEGKQDELKKLQDELTGGRRVEEAEPAVAKKTAKKPAAKKVAEKKPAAKPKTAATKKAAPAKKASPAKKK